MKKLTIGLSCSPSKIIKHEEITLKEVLISYGGGMGGANMTYFCTEAVKVATTPFYKLTRVNGEEKRVNERFIVEMGNVRLVKVVSDVTAHRNYRDKNATNGEKVITTEYFKLEYDEEYEVVNKYVSRSDGLGDRKVKI